jgi:hypothetical protein
MASWGMPCSDSAVAVPALRTRRIDLHCQGDKAAGCNFYEDGRRLGVMRFLGRDSTTGTTSIIAELDRRSR